MDSILEQDHVVGAREGDLESIKAIETPTVHFDSLASLLNNTRVGDLTSERRTLAYVNRDEPALEAWRSLIDHKVLSLPIHDQRKTVFIGFVDIVDVLNIIVNHFTENELVATQEADLQALLGSRQAFAGLTVADLHDPKRIAFLPVDTRMPLREAIRLMIEWKTHRLPVVDAGGELVTILSQSRVASHFAQHLPLFSFSGSRIGDLPDFITRDVVSVKNDQKTIDAFKLIRDKNVNGVAVLDDSGKLMGNLSASDLRVIGYSMKIIQRLFLSVGEFLSLIPPSSEFVLVCVTELTTFEELLVKIQLTKVHRLYVVKEDKTLVGVLTLTDILRYVLNHTP